MYNQVNICLAFSFVTEEFFYLDKQMKDVTEAFEIVNVVPKYRISCFWREHKLPSAMKGDEGNLSVIGT